MQYMQFAHLAHLAHPALLEFFLPLLSVFSQKTFFDSYFVADSHIFPSKILDTHQVCRKNHLYVLFLSVLGVDLHIT